LSNTLLQTFAEKIDKLYRHYFLFIEMFVSAKTGILAGTVPGGLAGLELHAAGQVEVGAAGKPVLLPQVLHCGNRWIF
jgi:hypothetical protein